MNNKQLYILIEIVISCYERRKNKSNRYDLIRDIISCYEKQKHYYILDDIGRYKGFK